MREVLERAFDTAEKSHWQIKTLGQVCRTSSGGTPSRSRPDFFNGNIPWVKSGELTDGLVSEVIEFISEEALASSSAKLLDAISGDPFESADREVLAADSDLMLKIESDTHVLINELEDGFVKAFG